MSTRCLPLKPYRRRCLLLVRFCHLFYFFSARNETKSELPTLDWVIAIKLIAIMVCYGAILETLGFLIATCLFLFSGYWLLGERRKHILFLCSVPLVIFFWYVLTQLLDIYLAPGALMQWIIG